MQDLKVCKECHWPYQENGLDVCGFTCLLIREGLVFSKKAIMGLIGFSLIILANISSYFLPQHDFYLFRFEIILGVLTYLFLSWPFFRFFRHIRLIARHFYGLLWLVSLADFLISVGWGLYSMTHQDIILMRPLFVTGIFLILVVNYFAPREFALRQKIIFEPKEKLDLRPKMARAIVKKQEVLMATQDLKPGDIVKIMPGEVIPCDGIILSGTTSVNETIILGESSVRLCAKGDDVLAASMNRDGVILVEVSKPIADNFIVKKIALFKKALDSRPVFFTKNSHYYLVLIPWVLVGVLKFLFVHNLSTLQLVESFVVSLSLYGVVGLQLIFFLPALWDAIHEGILIPTLKQVQRLSVLNAIYFDKSGTLTKGQFTFSEVFLERGTNQGVFLSTVFSLEANLTHPIAKGIKTHPWYLEIPLWAVKDIAFQAGLGVSGVITERGQGDRTAAFGNMRLMKRLQMQTTKALREKVEELEAIGETVLLCAWDGAVRGIFSLADVLRTDVTTLLTRLMELRVEPEMITGDHDQMISHLQVTHGLKHIYTRCLPSEKASKIHKKQGPLTHVGVVGTLYDDPKVIGAGDVGILLGTRDVIADSGEAISIFGKNLSKITTLLTLSRYYGRNWHRSQKIALVTLMIAAFISILPFAHPVLVGGVVTIAWNMILKKLEFFSSDQKVSKTNRLVALPQA